MADIVKAGYLLKESTFLKRWKKYWFSLSADGYLRYFESPDNLIAIKTVSVPRDIISLKTGRDVPRPPDASKSEVMIQLMSRDQKSDWKMCAESIDDMLAWQIALEQARVLQNRQNAMNPNQQLPPYLLDVLQNNPNNGYPMYYRGAYRGQYPTRIVHTPQGPITVVYINDPYYRSRYRGSNFGYGALAGAALGSALIWPFWFPFFWC